MPSAPMTIPMFEHRTLIIWLFMLHTSSIQMTFSLYFKTRTIRKTFKQMRKTPQIENGRVFIILIVIIIVWCYNIMLWFSCYSHVEFLDSNLDWFGFGSNEILCWAPINGAIGLQCIRVSLKFDWFIQFAWNWPLSQSLWHLLDTSTKQCMFSLWCHRNDNDNERLIAHRHSWLIAICVSFHVPVLLSPFTIVSLILIFVVTIKSLRRRVGVLSAVWYIHYWCN